MSSAPAFIENLNPRHAAFLNAPCENRLCGFRVSGEIGRPKFYVSLTLDKEGNVRFKARDSSLPDAEDNVRMLTEWATTILEKRAAISAAVETVEFGPFRLLDAEKAFYDGAIKEIVARPAGHVRTLGFVYGGHKLQFVFRRTEDDIEVNAQKDCDSELTIWLQHWASQEVARNTH